ncbi:hypothetical protein U1Q18_036253, partial [Sarracenia purpurea var. burkii]
LSPSFSNSQSSASPPFTRLCHLHSIIVVALPVSVAFRISPSLATIGPILAALPTLCVHCMPPQLPCGEYFIFHWLVFSHGSTLSSALSYVVVLSLLLSLSMISLLVFLDIEWDPSSSGHGSHSKKRTTTESEDIDHLLIDVARAAYAMLAQRGILMERNIHSANFAQIGLATQFEQHGWLGLGSNHVVVFPEMVLEFYFNVTGIDMATHSLTLTMRGRRLIFSVQDIVSMYLLGWYT